MRTTINIDDDLLARASELTGITERTALVRAGLRTLVEREAARRLALLGGTMPDLVVPGREDRTEDDTREAAAETTAGMDRSASSVRADDDRGSAGGG